MIEYDPHKWAAHFFDLRGSMLRQIVYRVMFCVVWSALVIAFDSHVIDLSMPSDAHALIGVALGLLLVFRTNASYDRFWEGRKLWGAIVNASRNLARGSAEYLDPATAGRVIRWAIALPHATMHVLREKHGPGPLDPGLPESERLQVQAIDRAPLAIARRVSAELEGALRRGQIGEVTRALLDQNVQLLVDCLGGCERILRTPLPFAYTVHLRRALVLYCLSLPFALVNKFGWGTLPAVFLIAYTMFGIEEIGVEIENPFGEDDNDLPLGAICQRIEADLRSVIATLPETGDLPG